MYPYRPSEYQPRPPGLPVEGVGANGPRQVDEFDPTGMPFVHAGERVVVRVCCGSCHALVGSVTASASGLIYTAKALVADRPDAGGVNPGRPRLVDITLDLHDPGHATLLAGGLAAYCRRHGTIRFARPTVNAAVERFRTEGRTQILNIRPG